MIKKASPLRTEPVGIVTITYTKDGKPPITRPFGLNWASENGYLRKRKEKNETRQD